MTAGKIAWGCFILAVLLYAADLACGWFLEWLKRRDEFIRNAELNRYNMGAFKGTKDWRDL
jgi:hypothetical protein